MKYYKVTYVNKHFRHHTDFIKAYTLEAAQEYADSTARFFSAQHDGLTECNLRDIRNDSGNSIIDLTSKENCPYRRI